MRVRSTLVLLAALAACSSSTSNTDPNPTPDAPGSTPTDAAAPPTDAAPRADAAPDAPPPPATVVEVTCPASPAATITANNNVDAYMPVSVTIDVGQVVRFSMPSSHDVAPNATMSDLGLTVSYGETKCLMFTRSGTLGFHCDLHSFTGTVLVR